MRKALAGPQGGEGGDQGLPEGFCSRRGREPDSWLLTEELNETFRCRS